jgi:hypothetical protein
MKNIFLLIVIAALFNQSFAQDTSKTDCKELKHGIQFQVTNIFNLTNYGGYTLAYRYQINRNSGLRFGVYTLISNEDYEITQQVDTIINKPPVDAENFNIKLSVQYLHRILNYHDFDLLVGGGPFFAINNSKYYDEYLNSYSISKYTSKNDVTSFGLDLLVDVEYRLTSNVVFSGEYGFVFTSDKTDFEEKRVEDYYTYQVVRNESGTRDRISLRGSNVSLGLTIFF